MKCSKTIDTLSSPLTNTLFPEINPPINWSTGISYGKLNGVIKATGPYGNLKP